MISTTIKDWFQRHFSDPEAVGLVLLIVISVGLLFFLGSLLTPIIASAIIAYLLNGLVHGLQRIKLPKTFAAALVCILFVGLLYVGLLLLLPLLWEQLANLFNEIPKIMSRGNELIMRLHERYPEYISVEQIKQLLLTFKADLASFGQTMIAYSFSSLSNLLSLVIYLVLVPIMVFFMLKDSEQITKWTAQFLPRRRTLIRQVWSEVDEQIGRYVRAKVLEIFIVGGATIIVFIAVGLNYAVLLSVLHGLSVLIPYVGVMLVSIPVVIVAYLQFGWTGLFALTMVLYGVIGILDGNVLAPMLFSDATRLHPLAVIVAILVFGGLWGFWGVFFAIPLATLVMAIMNAWPVNN